MPLGQFTHGQLPPRKLSTIPLTVLLSDHISCKIMILVYKIYRHHKRHVHNLFHSVDRIRLSHRWEVTAHAQHTPQLGCGNMGVKNGLSESYGSNCPVIDQWVTIDWPVGTTCGRLVVPSAALWSVNQDNSISIQALGTSAQLWSCIDQSCMNLKLEFHRENRTHRAASGRKTWCWSNDVSDAARCVRFHRWNSSLRDAFASGMQGYVGLPCLILYEMFVWHSTTKCDLPLHHQPELSRHLSNLSCMCSWYCNVLFSNSVNIISISWS